MIKSILWIKSKQKSCEGMKELREGNVFPRDLDTLWVIREMEAGLGLHSKDIDKLSYTELIEYINQLVLMLLKYRA